MREAEQALETKRSMVRHIGHEIRTPLNIVAVGTDVLRQVRACARLHCSGEDIHVLRALTPTRAVFCVVCVAAAWQELLEPCHCWWAMPMAC